MKRKQGQILTAVLVDYDNIYLALRRKNEDAARRFAKDAGLWLKEIESGSLITPTNSVFGKANRRIVLNRCYGNPVPRRNTHDNSTDMSSFPFVRHHFLRAGFEVVDCPPLTAQLKNSSDIRMVMDVRDFLLHDTYFDEFIILSGDSDFTPVLHRLRAHARRTVIFANDHTAVPYKAISDGEVREADLLTLLTEGASIGAPQPQAAVAATAAGPQIEDQRRAIVSEVMGAVRASRHPIPLDLLADRVIRLVGYEQTAGSGWAGAGGLRELLLQAKPEGLRISEQPPFIAYDTSRQLAESPRRAEIAAPGMAPAEATSTAAGGMAPSAEAMTLRAHPAFDPAPVSAQPESVVAAAPAPIESRQPESMMPPLQAPAAAASAGVQSGLGALGNIFRSALPPFSATLSSQDPAAIRSQPQLPQEAQHTAQQPPQLAQQVFAAAHQPPLQAGSTFGGLPSSFAAQQQPSPVPQGTAAHDLVPPPASLPPQLPQAAQPVAQAPSYRAPQQPSLPPRAPDAGTATAIQQSIARIHEACQAPPLSPPEYRVLFDVMAREINERGLTGSQTLTNIVQRAQEQGVDIRRDDVRFVLEVVSETDPWFEQGASSTLFAGRFRNFVVARCRSQGLTLSADELDLIEAWFVAGTPAQQAAPSRPAPAQPDYGAEPAPRTMPAYGQGLAQAPAPQGPTSDDEFPRIVRTRLRG
jgi:hypothetical protein